MLTLKTRKLKKMFIPYLNKIIKNKDYFFYGNSNSSTKYDSLIYCPHPFTNWSLNPNFKIGTELQHTSEGFRRVDNDLSIRNNWFQNKFSIYTLGGSTTYCTELKSYKESWPSILNNNPKLVVRNGGVGGWGSLQNFIRFSSWGPILKPKLTIVYLSKNDLTPFYNAREEENEIMPFYENIMLQFSSKINSVARNRNLSSIYSMKNNLFSRLFPIKNKTTSNGLDRFTIEHKKTTKIRFQLITDLTKNWGGSVLFVPEIIKKDSIYFNKMNEIHEIMKDVANSKKNADFFDIRNVLDYREEYFLDKMHLNAKGCDLFAKLIGNYIKSNYA